MWMSAGLDVVVHLPLGSANGAGVQPSGLSLAQQSVAVQREQSNSWG